MSVSTVTVPCLRPVGIANVLPNSSTTASGTASVATSKSAGTRPSSMSRTPPPTRCASWPASRSFLHTASTSGGTPLSHRRGHGFASRSIASQRRRRGPLLRLLLRSADRAAVRTAGQRQRHLEPLVVVGPFLGDHLVDGRRLPERLGALLQARLVVQAGVLIDGLDAVFEQPRRDGGDDVEPRVDVDRPHQRLQRVREDRRARAAAGPFLALAEQDVAPEIDRQRDLRQGALADQRGPRARQIAFAAYPGSGA